MEEVISVEDVDLTNPGQRMHSMEVAFTGHKISTDDSGPKSQQEINELRKDINYILEQISESRRPDTVHSNQHQQ